MTRNRDCGFRALPLRRRRGGSRRLRIARSDPRDTAPSRWFVARGEVYAPGLAGVRHRPVEQAAPQPNQVWACLYAASRPAAASRIRNAPGQEPGAGCAQGAQRRSGKVGDRGRTGAPERVWGDSGVLRAPARPRFGGAARGARVLRPCGASRIAAARADRHARERECARGFGRTAFRRPRRRKSIGTVPGTGTPGRTCPGRGVCCGCFGLDARRGRAAVVRPGRRRYRTPARPLLDADTGWIGPDRAVGVAVPAAPGADADASAVALGLDAVFIDLDMAAVSFDPDASAVPVDLD